MKKGFLMCFALMFVLFIPIALYAQSAWVLSDDFESDDMSKWVLYDDFNSGYINETLWNIYDSSAVITVENGKAKFTYISGHPNESSWLSFKDPGRIAAVAATILVESSNLGSCHARIGGNTATTPEGYVLWQNIQIYSDHLVSYWSGELDAENNWIDVSQRLYVEFLRLYSGDLFGKEYTLMMTMQPTRRLTIGGPEVGMMNYMTRQMDLAEYNDPFVGIGIHSGDAEGSMVVYFDNVFVKYKTNK
jgi:hypothetical protein